ncbi:MAG: VOC family protein [Phycisphaerae bacterium]|nr:VOC family protein [Phycisphaerae bacterium]
MGDPLCHFEFMSDDPAKSKAFYTEVFGWKYDETSMPDYTLIKTGKEPGGGLMKRPAEAPQAALNVYFMVSDIEATLGKVQQGGGQVIVPNTPIPNVGSFAMFADPEGIVVGIFQT